MSKESRLKIFSFQNRIREINHVRLITLIKTNLNEFFSDLNKGPDDVFLTNSSFEVIMSKSQLYPITLPLSKNYLDFLVFLLEN